MVLTFTKKHTEVCKGIAVLLLLWHHLYYMHPEQGWLVYHTAVYAKVCVHIFLILSGYGLFYSMRKRESNMMLNSESELRRLWSFYKSRFMTLMPRYWIIFILGVGIYMAVLHKMPADVFKKTSHPWIYLVLQFLGLHMLKFGGYGYNPTWWYMTTIIMLYIVFPYIYKLISEYPVTAFAGLSLYFLYRPDIPAVGNWGVPFVLGVFLAKIMDDCSVNGRFKNGWLQMTLAIGGATIITIFFLIPYLRTNFRMFWMTALGLEAIMLGYFIEKINWVGNALSFVGRHSYNIFLCHTFINFWFLFKFIYKFRSSPIWSLPLLLGLSLACSLAVEYIYCCIWRGFEKMKSKQRVTDCHE